MTVNYIYNVTTAGMKQAMKNRKSIHELSLGLILVGVGLLIADAALYISSKQIEELEERVKKLEEKGVTC